ncbi:MAG: SusC/RagA family TonB-linked outer membrane protein [Marinilabiliaceae bacterium]|nr:SusC/RagA family TonB-linked outer membrane protein [Marinilabiliaceae bacterium]
MKNNRIITFYKWFSYLRFIILLLTSATLTWAGEKKVIQSQVTSVNETPIEGAMVLIDLPTDNISAVTDSNGTFNIDISTDTITLKGTIEISAEGYYPFKKTLQKSLPAQIKLQSIAAVKYNGQVTMENITESREIKSISTNGIRKKDLNKDVLLDIAIQDQIPGLLVIGKSGMPNEGAYLNVRGVHSFIASNSPLIVLNGIPYLGNENTSNAINGYSRSILSAINVNDIKSVTLLKGANASLYGSLGSNGVLLIETEQATSDNLDTRISFTGQYGLRTANRNIPSLGVTDYKNYLQDIGMTQYNSLSSLVADYPFLENSDNYYSYLFNNNTDWNSEIESQAFVTDNVFRVEGGDEIAKYNISFGYTSEGGVIGDTKTDRYNTLINTNIIASRKVALFANVGLAYITGKLQEQGMVAETNPLLASSLAMPLLSPYRKEPNGNILDRYATYDGWNTNENPTFDYDNVSNPLAIVNTVNATDKIYDANIRFGINFYANRHLTLTGLLNLYYNYTEETNFIPGVTDQAIIPQYFGIGYNTVRRGVTENHSNFYGLNASYQRTFNIFHQFKGSLGMRTLGSKVEFDYASGYNTPNDYLQSLGKATEDLNITGDNLEWTWVNYYLHGDYTYNNLIKTSLNMAIDGSSVSGVDAPRYGLFPSLGLTLMLGNRDLLPNAISIFNLSAEFSRTGNSRFSSNYAKNYYQNSNLFNLGTIIRKNVPNTNLEWEKNDQFEVGIDMSLFNYLIDVQANYFWTNANDLLIARNISSVYGSSEYYDNTGSIASKGMEIALRLNPIRTKNFDWALGGSISQVKSEIKTLGNSDELFINFESFNNDDALVIMKKGESPYQFYGYKTDGIYTTTNEATSDWLNNIYGNPYQAGDVKFVNTNNEDNDINAKDKVLLGSAEPDFFGNLFTSFRYKKLSLLADFAYSYGNMAYNAVRRDLESMSTFRNQSVSVKNRWQVEGQNAQLPRAAYGDPAGNNSFSDRWIEDASYIKLRNITLKYDFGKILNVCQSGSVYISGENLFTLTDYLGADPEFSYSYNVAMQGFDYAKVARPKTILAGFQLNF